MSLIAEAVREARTDGYRAGLARAIEILESESATLEHDAERYADGSAVYVPHEMRCEASRCRLVAKMIRGYLEQCT